MFRCTYLFEKECQLYSKECLGKNCNLYKNCGGCKHRMTSAGDYPCSNCSIKSKYGSKK